MEQIGRAEEKTMRKLRKKGSMLQFGGCVLLSLGLLNILLALKSGSGVDSFYFAISAVGAVSLAAGLWRARD